LIRVLAEKCTGCKRCEKNCPLDAIVVTEKLAEVDFYTCVNCRVCMRSCPQEAILEAESSTEFTDSKRVNIIICDSCPINCKIPDLIQEKINNS